MAIGINEFPRDMAPKDLFPVDCFPGDEILSTQPERHPLLEWDREGLLRIFGRRKSSPISERSVCVCG